MVSRRGGTMVDFRRKPNGTALDSEEISRCLPRQGNVTSMDASIVPCPGIKGKYSGAPRIEGVLFTASGRPESMENEPSGA